MHKTLRFEAIAESHISAVLEIEQQSNNSAWSERSFRNELDHPHGIFLCAFVEGKVVGYGGVWLVIDEAHVTTLAIDPAFRRQGIGARLIAELLTRARDRGMECATLEVRASNVAAIKLYEKIGFVAASVRKGYYPDNKEDALVMWLHDLEAWKRDGK